MALAVQDVFLPKQQTEQQICLLLPFSGFVVVILYAVLALCHWQLSARFAVDIRGSFDLDLQIV